MRIVDPRTRLIAVALALLMVADVIFPTALFALSSGPSQPEVQGFQPAGTEDMVDLFSGDMSYNISLLDVEGYPVNLFYKAGPGMDQEASWVGLGWNLNAGVVERNLRGLPDDFDGGADAITRTMGLRPNQTMGVSLGLSLELFGLDNIGLSTTLSPSYNNYEGMQFQTGVSLSMRSTEGNKFSKSLDLGLTSHSSQSLRMQAGVSFDKTDGKVADAARPGLNFGLTLDGRQGLSNISFGAGLSTHDKAAKTTTRLGSLKGAYDIGPPTYTPMISMSMNNSSLSFNFTLGAALFGLHPNSRLGAFFSDNRLRASTVTNPAYGYLHMEHAGRNGMLDFNREKDGPYTGDISALSIVNMTNDVFSVNAQGLSGSYRAFRSEVGHVSRSHDQRCVR
jgi:hypothetical protein